MRVKDPEPDGSPGSKDGHGVATGDERDRYCNCKGGEGRADGARPVIERLGARPAARE